MPCFEIEHYAVRTELQRVATTAGVQSYATRVLELTSAANADGHVLCATLTFSTLFEPWYSRPFVGSLERSDRAVLRLSIWLPIDEFLSYYDILHHEHPVFLCYTLRYRSMGDGFVSQVALGSHPIGDQEPGPGAAPGVADRAST